MSKLRGSVRLAPSVSSRAAATPAGSLTLLQSATWARWGLQKPLTWEYRNGFLRLTSSGMLESVLSLNNSHVCSRRVVTFLFTRHGAKVEDTLTDASATLRAAVLKCRF